MILLKWIILGTVFILSINLGLQIAKQYKNRVLELKEMKNALNAFKTKIKYERQPIKDVFLEVSNNLETNAKEVFVLASKYLEYETAEISWTKALENADTYMVDEDIKVLKILNKLLGKTDLEGQLSQIDLTTNFLDTQIAKAGDECVKNENLFKKVGVITGFGIIILLL